MAALTDATPVGPLTDNVMLSVEDKFVYAVGEHRYPLLSFLPNIGKVGQYYWRFAEEKPVPKAAQVATPTGATSIIASNSGTKACFDIPTGSFGAGVDVLIFEAGDIIEVYSATDVAAERMLVVGQVAANPLDVEVIRGFQGTTKLANIALLDNAYLVGKNTPATGAAIPVSRSAKKAYVNAYIKRIEESVILALMEENTGQPLPKGAANSLAAEKMKGLRRWKERAELELIKGIATAASATAATGPEGYSTDGLLARITAALGAHVTALDAGGQLSNSKFDNMLSDLLGMYDPEGELWALGGRKVYEAGPTWILAKQIITGQNLKGVFGSKEAVYQTKGGPTVRFIYEAALNAFATDTLILINPNFVGVKNGPNGDRVPKYTEVAQELIGRKAGFWSGEFGSQIECPWAHGLITGVKRAV